MILLKILEICWLIKKYKNTSEKNEEMLKKIVLKNQRNKLKTLREKKKNINQMKEKF